MTVVYGTSESLVAIQGTGWINNHCCVPGDNGHSHIPTPRRASPRYYEAARQPAALIQPVRATTSQAKWLKGADIL